MNSKNKYVVNVIPISSVAATGKKCSHGKRCRNYPTYSIFYWDGKPMLSRLLTETCDKHLTDGVNQAWKENDKIGK